MSFDNHEKLRGSWWTRSAQILLGLLMAWSAIDPCDAVSVFVGYSLAQDTLWLMLCGVALLAATVTGTGFGFSRTGWLVVSGLLLWMVIGATLSDQATDGRVAWYGFWHVVAVGGGYFVCRWLFSDVANREVAVQLMAATILGLALHGAWQVAVQFPQDRAAFERDPEAKMLADGIHAPEGSPQRRAYRDRLFSPEPYSMFALTNSLAVLLSVGLVLWIAAGTTYWREGIRNNTLPLFAVLLAVCCIGLVWTLTRSRAAYVGLAAIGVFLVCGRFWAARGRGQRIVNALGARALGLWLVSSCVLCVLGLMWFMRNDAAVISEAPKSLAFRLQYWAATLQIIADHGIWGVGLGNFQAYYPCYMFATASETIADPHNWILDIAVSLSVPVALVCVAWLAQHLWQGIQQHSETDRRGVGQREALKDNLLIAWPVWGGWLVGLFLVPLGLMMLGRLAHFPGLEFAFGLASALVARRGLAWAANQPLVISAAIAGMLVCLLSSGSWQANGLLVPLTILLAVVGSSCQAGENGGRVSGILFGEFKTSAVANSRGQAKSSAFLGKLMGAGKHAKVLCVSGSCMVVGMLFLKQHWEPVLQSMRPARPTIESLELAAEVDPLSSEPLRELAYYRVAAALDTRDSGRFERLGRKADEAIQSMVNSQPIKFLAWQEASEHYLRLAAHAAELRSAQADQWVLRASETMEMAVRRYPTSARLQLQLVVCDFLSKNQISEEPLRRASMLSEGTPHDDKKLVNQQLFWPSALRPVELGDGRQDASLINAELVLNWLRNRK